MHLRNIACIFSIDEVIKLDKSIEINDLQSSNICKTLVTFEVSNLDKSKEVNDIHLTNIAAIVITFEVEKLEISSNFKLSHS